MDISTEAFRFAHVYDGTVFSRTVSQVVQNLDEARRADDHPGGFYVAVGDTLVPVTFETSRADFDERDWATVTVTIKRADTGEVVGTGSYVVDGRS